MSTECRHEWKSRLLGYDARLWQCAAISSGSAASNTDSACADDQGCGLLFVEGRTWRGEPAWLPLGVTSRFDICCGHCLDGFCTSVGDKPCDRCGRSSARAGVSR